MIFLIAGASHTGKTLLAQKLLEKYKYPYLSIDHLKMGLIRSKNTNLTPLSDDESLTAYLWPVVREMIKTAVENEQNLIVEGCYIPFEWKKDFEEAYLQKIRYCCIVLSEEYIENHYEDIYRHACVIEKRLCDEAASKESLIEENRRILKLAKENQLDFILVENEYNVDPDKAFT